MSKDKIEVNMNIYDIPIVVEQLEKANKEIERLNNIIKEQGLEDKPNYYVKGLEGSLKEYQEEIERLNKELQQKENIIKELKDKIEDDKMIIEGNWGCIDNLRKDYNLQKNIIKEVREDLDKQIDFCTNEANGTTNDKYCRIAIQYLKHLKQKLDKENRL